MTFYFLRGATKAGGNSSLRQGRKLQESPCQARKSITDILNRPRADYRLAGDSFSDLAFSALQSSQSTKSSDSGVFLGLLSSYTRLAVGNMLLNSGDSRVCFLLRFFVIFCGGRRLFNNARCALIAAWVA